MPAAALVAGIWLSDCSGFVGSGVYYVTNVMSAAAIIAAVILTLRRKGPPGLPAALVLLAALFFGYARHQHALHLPERHVSRFLADEPMLTRLAGRIVAQPTAFPSDKRNPFLPNEPSPRVRFVLDATEFVTTEPPTPTCGLLRVSVEAESIDADMGDVVVLTGKLYRPRGPRNPGEMDWARWNRLQHVHAGMKVEDAVHVRRLHEAGAGRFSVFGAARAFARRMLLEPYSQAEMDRPQRLLDALVLGQRSAAGRELNEAFLRSGSLHFLAVSGYHVGVLMGAAWLLFHRLGRLGTRKSALLMLVVLGAYVLVVEHNAPILRAATMGTLLCLALIIRRPFCGLNWLSLSALCILTCNPFELFRAGFQLSFVQVLAIITITPRVYRLVTWRRVENGVPADADTWRMFFLMTAYRWLTGLLVICVVAWITALPLVLHHFGRFAPWGALQSMIVSPFVMLTIVLGFFALLTQPVPLLGALFGVSLHGVTSILLGVVDHLSQWPNALIDVRSPPAWLVIATYGAVVLAAMGIRRLNKYGAQDEITSESQRRLGDYGPNGGGPLLLPLYVKRFAIITAVFGAIVFAWTVWLVRPASRPATPTACVLSVGDGLAVLIATPAGDAMLYDVGTLHNFDVGETAIRAARAMGADKLDALVISHANFDHFSGAPTVMNKWSPRHCFVNPYFQAAVGDAPFGPRGGPYSGSGGLTLRAGDRFRLGDIAADVLWPPEGLDDTWEANDRSIVLRITANGRRMLLTGDIEHAALRELVRRHEAGEIDLRADVLLAPHHGAVIPGETAAFYRAVSPYCVVSSASRKRDKLTALMAELFGDDVRLFSTRDAGAVMINFDRETAVAVETPFIRSD